MVAGGSISIIYLLHNDESNMGKIIIIITAVHYREGIFYFGAFFIQSHKNDNHKIESQNIEVK